MKSAGAAGDGLCLPGLSRFDWLRELDPDAVASPPLFMAFDLLYRDGRDLSARPLRDRRTRLDAVAGRELSSRSAAGA